MIPRTGHIVSAPGNRKLRDAAFPALAERLRARYQEQSDELLLVMLGQEYRIGRAGITLRGQKAPESHEAVILDHLASRGTAFIELPWRAPGDLEDVGVEFRERVELPLAQHAGEFFPRAQSLLPLFDGVPCPSMVGGDVAFIVRALPNVHVRVELSQENQEFPAEAWVLFSNNAGEFLSARGLLALGELFKERFISLLRIY